MAGETVVAKAGDGVTAPVIPLQQIEIVDEDEGGQSAAADSQHDPSDRERAGQYDYDPDAAVEDGKQPTKDARLAHFQADQGSASEQPQPGETPEQLTARQRRRQRDKQSRDRERAEFARVKAENEQLKKAVLHVDARVSNVERAGIDGQMASIQGEIKRAEAVMASAMSAQNGEDFTAAMEIRDQFRDRLNQLKSNKAKIETRTEEAEPTQATMPNGLPQAQVAFQQTFLRRHPWFRPDGRDRDSQSVMRLDNEMLAEGTFKPTDPQYWVELERRVQEDVPGRFDQASNDGGQQSEDRQQQGRGNKGANGQRPTGGPKLPGGGNGGGAGAGNGNPVRFHLSKARKDAMVASGAWDDPAAKDRQIRYFMKWDAENPSKGDR